MNKICEFFIIKIEAQKMQLRNISLSFTYIDTFTYLHTLLLYRGYNSSDITHPTESSVYAFQLFSIKIYNEL